MLVRRGKNRESPERSQACEKTHVSRQGRTKKRLVSVRTRKEEENNNNNEVYIKDIEDPVKKEREKLENGSRGGKALVPRVKEWTVPRLTKSREGKPSPERKKKK